MDTISDVQVTFRPLEKRARALRGKSILEVAKKQEIPIPYECDGKCTCGTCYVKVVEGMDHLSPIGQIEAMHLESRKLGPQYRLGCQARLFGDVVVHVAKDCTS